MALVVLVGKKDRKRKMRVEAKKVYRGLVSVRDYIVTRAIKNHEDLVVFNEQGEMVIPYEQLHTGKEITRNLRSMYNNKSYNLIDFRWHPIKKDENQMELF